MGWGGAVSCNVERAHDRVYRGGDCEGDAALCGAWGSRAVGLGVSRRWMYIMCETRRTPVRARPCFPPWAPCWRGGGDRLPPSAHIAPHSRHDRVVGSPGVRAATNVQHLRRLSARRRLAAGPPCQGAHPWLAGNHRDDGTGGVRHHGRGPSRLPTAQGRQHALCAAPGRRARGGRKRRRSAHLPYLKRHRSSPAPCDPDPRRHHHRRRRRRCLST